MKKIKIEKLHLFEKGAALFLFSLIGYFLFYFSVFSKNSFTLFGFILIIFFAFFFTEYIIYLFVLTLPLLSQVPKLFNLPFFSPSELLFLCLINACLLKVILNKEEVVLFKSPIDLPIAIFSLIGISSFLSTFITHYPLDFFYIEKVPDVLKRMLFIRNPYDYSYIFTATFTLLEGILLFFVLTNFIKRERILNRIYILLILGWGIAIILGFVQYFWRILGYERSPERMFSTFDNCNLFGGYLALIFPFSILYAIDKSLSERMLLWILAMVSIVALILSRSKNSWVAFAALLFIMGIYFLILYIRKGKYNSSIKKLNWKWICVFVASFVIIFGSFYVYLTKESILGLLSEDLNWRIPIEKKLDIRLPLWKYTLQIVEDFPLWGIGIGEFSFALRRYSSLFVSSNEATFQPHNYFLQIAAELGMIGLYSFLWVLGTIFIKGFRMVREKRDFVKLGLWFGIIGFILTFFGDGYLWNIEMELMFFLLIGLLSVDEEGSEIAQTHRKESDKKLLFGLSFILLLILPFQIYQRSQISLLSDKTLGLYQEEFKDQGREYRWGEKVVLIPLEATGKWMNIPIRFGNPDILKHPVKAKIFINKKVIDHLDFKDNDWHMLRYPIQNMEGSEIILKIEVSRTWNPYLLGVRHETRELGPALGKIFWSS